MADFNSEARITLDYQQYLRALNELEKANRNLEKAVGGVRKAVNDQEQATNKTKKSLTEEEKAQRAANKAKQEGERAARANERALREQESQLIRTRYALYDVASSYAAVSTATLAAVTATTLAASKYETAFTEIERTTLSLSGNVSGNINQLREDFLQLARDIPLSFEELTKIGSLGAQLGIADTELTAFTETVAQFSRLSGVSPEETALAFGQIGNLLDVTADKYVNLGSAIAATAVSSAATDQQIISLTRELSAGAAGAGFAAEQVVGLASALASLRVPPERARGALDTYFNTLNQAVAAGGEDLENFATIVGVTSAELEQMVRNGDGAEVLQRFAQGLSQLDNVSVTQALDALNLSQLRIDNTFRRLGQNVELVNEQFQIAEEAFAAGTFLGDAYGIVLDDVASQFQLLLNQVGEFLATAGMPFLDFLRTALPLITEMVAGLADFAATDAGQEFFRIATFATVTIGAVAGLRAVMALATASVFALVTATNALGGTGLLASIRAMAGAMAGIGTSATASATGVRLLSGAITGLLRATIVLGLVAAAIDQIFYAGKGLEEVIYGIMVAWDAAFGGIGDIASGIAYDISGWASGVVMFINTLQDSLPVAGWLLEVVRQIALAVQNAAGQLGNLWSQAGRDRAVNWADGMGRAEKGNSRARGQGRMSQNRDAVRQSQQYWADFAANAAAGASGMSGLSNASDDAAKSLGGAGDAARDAAKEIRGLTDYASDLSGVFSRAFDIRFAAQLSIDTVADQWADLTERIRQARMEIQGLTAQRNVKEYFLSVANAYGDELRAGVIRAEIAEINEKIAETQADASTELEGNSKAARQNRKTITDLARGYQDYIVKLAEGGADQATLNAAVARSEAEFAKQARALGFSNAQLRPYIASFRDMTTVIANVPRNITITANADPALQALNEFKARADAARSAVDGLRSAASSPLRLSQIADLSGQARELRGLIAAAEAKRDAARAERLFAAANEQQQKIYAYQNALRQLGYAEGGFTGRGGKYDVAGAVHRGEYVIPKEGVNQSTGLPYAGVLGQLMMSSRGAGAQVMSADSGSGFGGKMMVELSPIDRKLLAAAGNVSLSIDGRVVSSTVGRINTVDALRGTN